MKQKRFCILSYRIASALTKSFVECLFQNKLCRMFKLKIQKNLDQNS